MYSADIKKLILSIYFKLKSLRKTQDLTNIPKTTISRWKNNILSVKREKIDTLTPVIIESITIILQLYPFLSVNEIQTRIKNTFNIVCSSHLIRLIMKKKMNLTYKKPKFINCPNEQKQNEQIKSFCSNFTQLNTKLNNPLIVSIDEVGFSSNSRPLKCWYKKGKINYIKIKPNIETKNKSSCVCITINGAILKYKTLNHPYNKIYFLDFLKSLSLPENTIILLDNVSFHHSKDVVKYAFEQKFNLLYTPPYCPWFNPIENVFSVVKNYYRKNRVINDSFNHINSTVVINSFNSAINKINNVFII
jgi:transposase